MHAPRSFVHVKDPRPERQVMQKAQIAYNIKKQITAIKNILKIIR